MWNEEESMFLFYIQKKSKAIVVIVQGMTLPENLQGLEN